MDGDQRFWIKIWYAIITGFIAMVMSISGCTMHRNAKISEAIKNGANPVEAGLALGGDRDISAKIVSLLNKEK